jgi:tripartite-type tricarboxylate transporter receptor subunit TctC
VTLVVTAAAGGPNDVLARILAPRMSEILGQPVIIENIVGAGGMTGMSRVASSVPDGYHFVIAGNGLYGYLSPQRQSFLPMCDLVHIALSKETI